MSRIGRKRISKWDLKEASQLSSGEIRNKSGPGKAAELDTSMAWDEVINYSTKMSPGLDDWRQQKHNCSPISGSGKSYRSRSRSPRDFRQESGRNDSRIVAQPLKDHSKDHERRRSVDIPCKFFAAGNCRNGQSCRFSHLGQTRDSPDDMSRNDWRRKSNNTSHVDQVSGGSKWKDMNVPDVSRLPEWNSERSIERIDLNFSAAVPSGQSLDPNGPSSSAFPKPIPGLNVVGQSQQTFTAYAPMEEFITNTQNQQLFQQARSSFSLPDVGDTKRSEAVISEIPSSQNTVSREELSQLTQLSANLARLFETGQLYAALNTSNSMGRMPNPAIGSKKPNDPRSRSIELIKPDTSNHPPGFEPTSVEGCIADEKPELLPSSVTGGASYGDLYNKKEDPVANCKSEENDRMAAEENKKGQDGGSLEKMDGDGRAEETKNGKGIRAFKFALVEFVKELLKPTWKEGQISKEAHKTIVKKVVDKVTGSIQAVHIPQSQEKIDNYLSSSKPKLSKLVQAYVERYQKS